MYSLYDALRIIKAVAAENPHPPLAARVPGRRPVGRLTRGGIVASALTPTATRSTGTRPIAMGEGHGRSKRAPLDVGGGFPQAIPPPVSVRRARGTGGGERRTQHGSTGFRIRWRDLNERERKRRLVTSSYGRGRGQHPASILGDQLSRRGALTRAGAGWPRSASRAAVAWRARFWLRRPVRPPTSRPTRGDGRGDAGAGGAGGRAATGHCRDDAGAERGAGDGGRGRLRRRAAVLRRVRRARDRRRGGGRRRHRVPAGLGLQTAGGDGGLGGRRRRHAWPGTSRMADVAPGFALHDAWPTQNVSLADLFSHRSGLPDHAGDVLEDLGFDRDEVMHRLRYLEPEYSFREGYAYTNFGLTAAAVAVAATAGMTWEDLVAERLYAPLGMDPHQLALCRLHGRDQPRRPPRQGRGSDWIVTPMQREPDAQSPAGGVSSTARELAQWVRLQLGQGALRWPAADPRRGAGADAAAAVVSHVPQDPARQRAGFYGLGHECQLHRLRRRAVEPLRRLRPGRGDGGLPAAGVGIRGAGADERRAGRRRRSRVPERAGFGHGRRGHRATGWTWSARCSRRWPPPNLQHGHRLGCRRRRTPCRPRRMRPTSATTAMTFMGTSRSRRARMGSGCASGRGRCDSR